MRLSRKASEMASKAFAHLETECRRMAAERALFNKREFADESDVAYAYARVMVGAASDVNRRPGPNDTVTLLP